MKIITRKEAIEQGLKRYFTGKPCKRGHISERFVSTCNCIECINYLNKTDKYKEWRKKNYIKNADKFREKSRRYYKDNPDINKNAVRNWRENNRDKVNQNANRYNRENREVLLEKRRQRRIDNNEYHRSMDHLQRARIRNAEGTHTGADIKWMEEKQKGKCVYCKTILKNGYHVDHIIPLAKGGDNTKFNIQLLCPHCNLSKGAKDPVKFAQSIGMLL